MTSDPAGRTVVSSKLQRDRKQVQDQVPTNTRTYDVIVNLVTCDQIHTQLINRKCSDSVLIGPLGDGRDFNSLKTLFTTKYCYCLYKYLKL